MKFSSSVDALSKENKFLRTTVKTTLCIAAILIVHSIILYNKEPLMIERTTRGLEIVSPAAFSINENEIKNAVRLMVKARFETEALSPELFLSARQLELRDAEQKELKSRNMAQSVVVRAVKISKSEGVVDFDRVLALGEVRSALRTRIKVAFDAETPNELNPFGIVLSLADPEKPEEKR